MPKVRVQSPGTPSEATLDSWKAIADYLHRTVRTVQRWEGQQGLPVQRLHHNKLGSIFARTDDLDDWVRSRVTPHAESGGQRASFTREHSADAEANRLYAMSRSQWNLQTPDGIMQSIELARLAIKRDKDYALAHAMLATCFMTLATYVPQAPEPLMEAARLAATDALMIDPNIASARTVLGAVHLTYDFDWSRAAGQLRAAIGLDPYDALSHVLVGFLNLAAGDAERGLSASRTAERLEPTSPLYASQTAWFMYFDRQFDAAVQQLQEVLGREPKFFRGYVNSAWALIASGRVSEGLEMAEVAAALNPRYPTMIAILAHACAAAGQQSRARDLLESITRSGEYASHYYVGIALAALGDMDRAVEALSTAVELREWLVILLRHDPALDPFRADGRFDALVRRVGLPANIDDLVMKEGEQGVGGAGG